MCGMNKTTMKLPPLSEVTLPDSCTLTCSRFIFGEMKQIGEEKINLEEDIQVKDLWEKLEKNENIKVRRLRRNHEKIQEKRGPNDWDLWRNTEDQKVPTKQF